MSPPLQTHAWPALWQARAHDPAQRLPFYLAEQRAGSVWRGHLSALAPWHAELLVASDRVQLCTPAVDRDAVLAAINTRLREDGLICGWRNEAFAVTALGADGQALDGEPLATMERAATRFWGSLTLGAHGNGCVLDTSGRITHLWVAQRADHKSTDPGRWDNLVGGGVAAGQTPLQTLEREAWEEAGLMPANLEQVRPVQRGSVLSLCRDLLPEPSTGLNRGLQREDLHAFDITLPAGVSPHNQDGEVQRFECLPLAQALELAASGAMTVDAALVTLDFFLRHGSSEPLSERLNERSGVLGSAWRQIVQAWPS